MRILSMAHGHPDLIKGGGELAAATLHHAYRDSDAVEAAWFLARGIRSGGASGRILTHRRGEHLWEQGLADLFTMTAMNRAEVAGRFPEYLRELRPTVVHTHHYFQFGLEYLRAIKRTDPSIRTVLTLHDYIAICPNHGLMKTLSGKLIPSGHYADHLGCAEGVTLDDLWLRHHRFQRFFDFVDHFISPSEFLRDRYIEWGIAPDRITVIENGQPPAEPLPPRALGPGEGPNRFAFFGQLGPHKGLDVVLEGIGMLSEADRRSIVLEVHGANLEFHGDAFRARIEELAKPLMEEGVLRWVGPYEPEEMDVRMAGIDWVIVPSVWYENSPLVIQEALGRGRPVIASQGGALSEKVPQNVAGVLLPMGQPAAWGEGLLKLSAETDRWTRLLGTLPVPASIAETSARCLSLFTSLLEESG